MALKCTLIGSRYFGATVLAQLLEDGHEVVRVVANTADDRLALAAQKAGLPLTVLESPRKVPGDALKEDCDLIVAEEGTREQHGGEYRWYIDPLDGNVWAYERCGASGAGGGPVDCETNPVDPIFKFDRQTGAVLANFGKNVMVTPHGISVDRDGNVWVTDFSGNKAGTKGHQVHKFSPNGEKLLSLGTAGRRGSADGQFNQPNDVVVGPDGVVELIHYGPLTLPQAESMIVQLLPGRDGLLHISQISNQRVNTVAEHLKEGQVVKVKVLSVDRVNQCLHVRHQDLGNTAFLKHMQEALED